MNRNECRNSPWTWVHWVFSSNMWSLHHNETKPISSPSFLKNVGLDTSLHHCTFLQHCTRLSLFFFRCWNRVLSWKWCQTDSQYHISQLHVTSNKHCHGLILLTRKIFGKSVFFSFFFWHFSSNCPNPYQWWDPILRRHYWERQNISFIVKSS